VITCQLLTLDDPSRALKMRILT